jgi:hypothetical protein
MANLYTFGCSWANGTELVDDIKETHRFSRILSDKLNLNDINLSETGGSNIRSINLLLEMIINNTIKNEDIVLFQITGLERHEIPLETHVVQYPFIESGVSRWMELKSETQTFLKDYVINLDSRYFEINSELSLYSLAYLLSIQRYKSILIPAFWINLRKAFNAPNFYSKTMQDIISEKTNNGFCEGGHPNEVGHQLIAEHIYNNYL